MATTHVAGDTRPTTRSWLIAAPIAGMVGYLIAAAVNVANDTGGGDQGSSDWAIAIAISAVLTAAAIGFGLRAAKHGAGSMATTAIVLGVLGVVGIVVFWTGLPAIFGAAAVALSLAARQAAGSFPGPAVVGLVLGAVALVMGLSTMVVG